MKFATSSDRNNYSPLHLLTGHKQTLSSILVVWDAILVKQRIQKEIKHILPEKGQINEFWQWKSG